MNKTLTLAEALVKSSDQSCDSMSLMFDLAKEKSAAVLNLFEQVALNGALKKIEFCHQTSVLALVQLSMPLSPHVQSLCLSNCSFNSVGVRALGPMLQSMPALRVLDLSSNDLDSTAAAILADCFGSMDAPCQLHELLLECNALGSAGAAMLAKWLTGAGRSLRLLDISENRLGDDGARFLALVLHNNSCGLDTLIVRWNEIGTEGARVFSCALRSNTLLRHLFIAYNSIGTAGVVLLAKALETNISLCSLGLRENNICPIGAAALGRMLAVNSTLKTLFLYNNPIKAGGLKSIVDGIMSNIRSALSDLEVSACMLDAAGVNLLADALGWPSFKLASLHLRHCTISAVAAQQLQHALHFNDCLTAIDLVDCSLPEDFERMLSRTLQETNATLVHVELRESVRPVPRSLTAVLQRNRFIGSPNFRLVRDFAMLPRPLRERIRTMLLIARVRHLQGAARELHFMPFPLLARLMIGLLPQLTSLQLADRVSASCDRL